jgi:hypothetical protein
MSFRNDLDAANARIETLERKKRELAAQNAGLSARLHEPAVEHDPKPWPLASSWLTSLFDGFLALFSRR